MAQAVQGAAQPQRACPAAPRAGDRGGRPAQAAGAGACMAAARVGCTARCMAAAWVACWHAGAWQLHEWPAGMQVHGSCIALTGEVHQPPHTFWRCTGALSGALAWSGVTSLVGSCTRMPPAAAAAGCRCRCRCRCRWLQACTSALVAFPPSRTGLLTQQCKEGIRGASRAPRGRFLPPPSDPQFFDPNALDVRGGM
jgi:hypothetical protein